MSDMDSTSNTFIFPEKVGPFRKSSVPAVERFANTESWFYYSNYFPAHCIRITKHRSLNRPDVCWVAYEVVCRYTGKIRGANVFAPRDPSLVLEEINRLAVMNG